MAESTPDEPQPEKNSPLAALPAILTGATLPYLPFARVLSSEENRALMFFRHDDAWALLGLILATACVYAVAWLGLTRIPGKSGKLLRRLAVSAVIALALINLIAVFQPGLGGDHGYKQNYLLLGVLTLVIAAWTPVYRGFTAGASIVAKLGAPVAPVIVVFLLASSEYQEARQPSPFPESARETSEVGPVYVFLFDAMDRRVALEEDDARTRYPALHALVDQATLFSNSVSPSEMTERSVPRLLFQTEGELARHEDGSYTIEGKPSSEHDSIFSMLNTGHSTGVVGGWYLDYEQMLGDQVGWVRDSSYTRPPRRGFVASLETVIHLSSEYGFVPLIRGLSGTNDFSAHTHANIAEELHAQAIETIRDGGDDVIAFFHYPVPHNPYLFDREGLRDWDSIINDGDEVGYRLNLEYTDRLIGELTDAIRDSGRWDAATVVVTSDHGIEKQRTNVLVVKLPGQEEPRVVKQSFNSVHLIDWLRQNGLKR